MRLAREPTEPSELGPIFFLWIVRAAINIDQDRLLPFLDGRSNATREWGFVK
jgi:hypothetical protein